MHWENAMGSDWKSVKSELMKDPEFAEEYEGLAPEYELARSIIRLRLRRGLTQKQLADRLKTTQSVVSRLESGRAKPSLPTLKRLAEALDSRLVARLE